MRNEYFFQWNNRPDPNFYLDEKSYYSKFLFNIERMTNVYETINGRKEQHHYKGDGFKRNWTIGNIALRFEE